MIHYCLLQLYAVSGFPPPPKASAELAEARFAREGGKADTTYKWKLL
jgi:hypothetical protein